jgi:glycosyltransferase involved in cell wall biosynthesis
MAMARPGLSDRALRIGKRVWRRIAPGSLRRVAGPAVALLAARRVRAALVASERPLHPGPLLVSGLIAETKGVSEAARLTIAGLRHAGLSPIAHDLRPLLTAGPGARGLLPTDRPGGVWIAHVNAPEAIHALAYLDPDQWRGRYRIGYWAYELPRVPASWVRASGAFHELWVPSRFVADALKASGVTRRVRVMPHPVSAAWQPVESPRSPLIPLDRFVVLAMGDLRSSAWRKNLTGAIEIYKRAFPEPGRTSLVLKVQSEEAHPRFRETAAALAAGRSDISFLADRLSSEDMRHLIASCDVVLSPHRAEGYGLALAEAFLAGVPALATGWSGNVDFMKGLDELLISHSLVPVRDPYGVYRAAAQSWAEPDLDDGAQKLKALYASPVRRADLARLGMQAVQSQMDSWSRESLVDVAKLIASSDA